MPPRKAAAKKAASKEASAAIPGPSGTTGPSSDGAATKRTQPEQGNTSPSVDTGAGVPAGRAATARKAELPDSTTAGAVIGVPDPEPTPEPERFDSGRVMSSTNVDSAGVPDKTPAGISGKPDADDLTAGPGAHYYGQRQELRHSGKTSEEVNAVETKQREGRRTNLYGKP